MLSRVAATRKLLPATVANARCCSGPALWKREVLQVKEHPDRDLVNFPRYKRPEHPPPVRMGFIPEEWFQFFYPKTGLTGPYVFGIGLLTTTLSKEILILEPELLFGVVLFTSLGLIHKLYGKDIAGLLDKMVDKEIEECSSGLEGSKKALKEAIEAEELAQTQTGCQSMVFDAKKENIALQLEASFRQRQLRVHQEVKRKLDYHLEIINIERRLQQKHMTDWIIDNVLKSISAPQEKEVLNSCLADLKKLAAKA